MKQNILTGAFGSGKTAIPGVLQSRGYDIVDEAATAVIAMKHADGEDEPWAQAAFIDKIVSLQRRRLNRCVRAAVSSSLTALRSAPANWSRSVTTRYAKFVKKIVPQRL